MLTQATRYAAGIPESGDRLGATITTTGVNPDDEDTGYDSVYAGAPGEDLAGILDAGFVQGLAISFTAISPQTRQAGQRFGASLGTFVNSPPSTVKPQRFLFGASAVAAYRRTRLG